MAKRLQFFTLGSLGRGSRQEPEAEMTEERCLLACFSCFSYTDQAYLPGCNTAHCRLSPPTSGSNQEVPSPQICDYQGCHHNYLALLSGAFHCMLGIRHTEWPFRGWWRKELDNSLPHFLSSLPTDVVPYPIVSTSISMHHCSPIRAPI